MWSELPKCGLQLQKWFRRTSPTFLQLILFRTGEHRYQNYMKDRDFRKSWLRKGVCRVQQKDHVGNRMHLDVQKSAFGASFSAKRSVSRFVLSLSFYVFMAWGCMQKISLYLKWWLWNSCGMQDWFVAQKAERERGLFQRPLVTLAFKETVWAGHFLFGAPAVQVCYRIFVPEWSYSGPPRISN